MPGQARSRSRPAGCRAHRCTSSSHATIIAAESGGIYALSVQGSGLVYGTTPDIAEQVTYVDDLTGSAAYKKYLAGIVFTLGR